MLAVNSQPKELQVFNNVKKITISYPLTIEQIERYGVPQAMALGSFDGVHLGHQEVIRGAVAYARSHGIPASVMTFHPNPREVLGGEPLQGYITPLDEKLEQMARLGVNQLFVVRFDERFSQVTAEAFVAEILLPLRVQHAVVGFDYSFGHRGKGNPELLQQLGAGSMSVDVISPFVLNDEKVSSTRIRKHLAEGEVTQASRLLGRPYALSGTVVAGEGRGNTIGFPTANIELSEPYSIPCKGVYAVHVWRGEQKHAGVMNIGVKPTFHQNTTKPTLEAHLLDFSDDIYGEQVRVELIDYIRPERKFSSIEELVAQIGRDAQEARERCLQY